MNDDSPGFILNPEENKSENNINIDFKTRFTNSIETSESSTDIVKDNQSNTFIEATMIVDADQSNTSPTMQRLHKQDDIKPTADDGENKSDLTAVNVSDTAVANTEHAQPASPHASSTQPIPFSFPDPIDNFANSIVLTGHVFGVRDDVISMLQEALTSGDYFIPVEPLRVHHYSSTFEEIGFEGDKVTTIRYVVSYRSRPVHRQVIHTILVLPKVSQHIDSHLHSYKLQQYRQPQIIKTESWVKSHPVMVAVPTILGVIMIVLIVMIIVSRKRALAKVATEKKKPVKCRTTKSDKECPPPYSVENPLYKFETNAVMDGYSLP